MSTITPLSDPHLFTSLEPLLETRLLEGELFPPHARRCPFCDFRLTTYKTIPLRTVWTLAGPLHISERQLCCPNSACSGRPLDPLSVQPTPRIFKSPDLRQIVLPKMQYGLDVVLEIGRRAYTDPKPGSQLQYEFRRDYGFAPSLATFYRHIDLFEALSLGILAEHELEIAAQLQAQPAFVLTFDATEYHGGYKLYRAVDFLSGLCLGTLLVPTGNKAQLLRWRQTLYQHFGYPDYLVSDGEAALHSDPHLESTLPHQDCWYHVLSNVWEALLTDWHIEAKVFLQQTHYRRELTRVLQELEALPLAAWPPHGKSLRALVEFFLAAPAGRPAFEAPLALRLAQFQEARTLLTRWERTLKGHQATREGPAEPLLRRYRELKAQLPPQAQTDYFQHEIFTTDPFFQAFLCVKALIEDICTDHRFTALRRRYKGLHDEFQTLRSWLVEAVLRRNSTQGEEILASTAQTPSEARLQQILERSTARARAELAKIPKSLHAWQWRGGEPALPVEEKAIRLFQRILTRWAKKPASEGGFSQAVELLSRQLPFLLTFFQHAAIPVSTQALETDHGQLKQLWRRSAGGQDRAYTLAYHGHSASMSRNCVRGPGKISPLEILGFPPEVIKQWYYTCSQTQLDTARETMMAIRQPRRLRLQAARQSLQEAFKGSAHEWLEWAAQQLAAYLAQTAR